MEEKDTDMRIRRTAVDIDWRLRHRLFQGLALCLVAFLALAPLIGASASTGAPAHGDRPAGFKKLPLNRGAAHKGNAHPTQIIVKYRKTASPSALEDLRRGERLKRVKRLGSIRAEVLEVSGRSVKDAVADLNNRPEVEYAQPNYLLYPTGYGDEPFFGQEWGLHNTGQTITVGPANKTGAANFDINALEASTVTLGDPNLVVAVIDDGVDFAHPDLAGRQWVNAGESGGGKETNNVDDDNNGKIDDVNGWDFKNNDNTLFEPGYSHGTHVAGTIAASMDGQGIVGVAPNVKIMALKFLETNGTTAHAIEAIQYATQMGAKISNNSWGGDDDSPALKDAIQNCNCLFIAAAGNGGSDGVGDDNDTTATYPASFDLPNILSVAAINSQGALADFSNYGATSVDISAPGEDVLSTYVEAGTRTYAFSSGTSMATPHATGAAAPVASVNPAALTSPIGLKNVLMSTGKPVSSTAGKSVTGKMIDAKAAVDRALSTSDITPPTVSITAPAQGATVRGAVTISAIATDDTAVNRVEFFVGNAVVGADTTGTSNSYSISWDSASVADGNVSITARAYDSSGWEADSQARTVRVDNLAPDTTITSGPSNPTDNASAQFAFSSNEPGSTFMCKLDSGAYARCASPHVVAGVTQGAHTFAVKAVDAGGNEDTTPSTHTWTLDTTSPTATLTAPAAGATLTGTATLSATATDNMAVARVEFLVDDAQVGVDTTAPYSYAWSSRAVANGAHTIKARAFDTAGNAGLSAARSVTVSNVPDTTITAGPATGLITRSNTATIQFTSTPPGASFECSMDSTTAYTACASPRVNTGLAEGSHTFRVRARDANNTLDPSPAYRTWTVDTTAPAATLTAPANGATLTGSVTLTTTATDNVRMSSVQFLYNGALIGMDATSPYSYTWNSALKPDGPASITAKAIDSAGNTRTSMAVSVTLDNAPDTSITVKPASYSNVTAPSFGFASNQAGSRFECSLDAAVFSACASQKSYSGLLEGEHNFRVQAIDAQNRPDPTPASHSWNIDTTPPVSTVNSPAEGATVGGDVTLYASATDSSGVTRVEFFVDGKLVGRDTTTPYSYIWKATAVADGAHIVTAVAYDRALNAATSANRNVRVDNIPETAIKSSPGVASKNTATFTFTSTEASATFECRLDGAAFAACFTPKTYSGLLAGPHAFEVRAVEAGSRRLDPTPALHRWTVDLTAPTNATVTAPAAGATLTGAVTLSATATDNVGLSMIEFYVNGARVAYDRIAPYSLNWQSSGAPDGPATILARAVDNAGNTADSAGRAVTIDNAPQTTVASGPPSLTNSRTATFTFTSNQPNSTFECSLDSTAAFTACVSAKTYTNVGEGRHTFYVRASDAGGKVDATPASRVWTVDITAPETTITAGPSGTVTSTTASFTFGSSEQYSVYECSLDGAAYSYCGSSKTYTNLAAGSHTLGVRAKDRAGNIDATPAVRTWTVSP